MYFLLTVPSSISVKFHGRVETVLWGKQNGFEAADRFGCSCAFGYLARYPRSQGLFPRRGGNRYSLAYTWLTFARILFTTRVSYYPSTQHNKETKDSKPIIYFYQYSRNPWPEKYHASSNRAVRVTLTFQFFFHSNHSPEFYFFLNLPPTFIYLYPIYLPIYFEIPISLLLL